MMAVFGIVLEILDDGLEYFVVRLLAAVEDVQFALQNEQQLVDVAMFFEQDLNDV